MLKREVKQQTSTSMNAVRVDVWTVKMQGVIGAHATVHCPHIVGIQPPRVVILGLRKLI